ncbi:hypothetical protein M409DRAFT_55394 [Zasmidium cellare ATCC 36951]|uniref:Uncharacterized protein n=1 Tax=Zasmidium cellare ATCC 36951 TaxID=1080233 RepID=A0A6A6CIN8_ZASCE|nr:uncharacterized protein M409DRAFT_55394 [Zasmidium cellare ATCC 36951]KAF2166048.1 hypothetical protein M409DRAFT_55394 [Zasmidium cellare ATCC 36951]
MSAGERQRPAYRRNMSSYLLFGAGWRRQSSNVTAQPSSPLLPTHADPQGSSSSSSPANYHAISSHPPPASDQHTHRLPSAHAALATPAKPPIARANTTATAKKDEHADDNQPTRSRSRPRLHNRALTSTAAVAGRPELYPESIMESRPSLFSRAKDLISNQLELGEGTSYAHKNAPPAPSYWNDQKHSRYLVKLWDMVEERASNAKYAQNTTSRLVSTEKNMLHHFPELGEGKSVLTREWIEYVLGVSLRHPFCTADKMGRWEILASSSGTRGTWGPW